MPQVLQTIHERYICIFARSHSKWLIKNLRSPRPLLVQKQISIWEISKSWHAGGRSEEEAGIKVLEFSLCIRLRGVSLQYVA